MQDLTVPELAALNGKNYAREIKERLRDDAAWVILLDPVLAERTRSALTQIVVSIDAQKERADEARTADDKWLGSINSLRRHVKARLDMMAPAESTPSSISKEVRAWRSFSARLALALEEGDLDAVDTLTTPYGGMSPREWLAVRAEREMKNGAAQ